MNQGPIIYFDGVCGLCNAFVDFVMRRDTRNIFRFATLQGYHGKELKQKNFPETDSVLLLHNGVLYTESGAALLTLKLLGFPWNISYILIIVPRFLRDAIYRFIAKNRYRWFGRRTICRLPTPAEKEKFLD